MNAPDMMMDWRNRVRSESPATVLSALEQQAPDGMTPGQRGGLLALRFVCLMRLGQADAAGRLVKETLATHGDDAQLLYFCGGELAAWSLYPLAEPFARRAVELRPDKPVTWFLLGKLLQDTGELEEALAALEHTLDSTPPYPPAMLARGQCLKALGRTEEAITAYTDYLEHCPGDGFNWIELAMLKSDEQQWEAAAETYRQALQHGAEPCNVYYNWAITAERQGDIGLLRNCATQLAEHGPDSWNYHQVQAMVCEAEGDLEAAWLSNQAALAQALGEREPEFMYAAAQNALQFLGRNPSPAGLAQVKQWICEQLDLLCAAHGDSLEPLLARLRRYTGEVTTGFEDWVVMVRARSQRDDASAAYARTYGVLAANQAAAERWAMEFERATGAGEVRVYRAEPRGRYPGEQEALGVWQVITPKMPLDGG